MDQTGVHLVPSSNWTYEAVGASSVAVIGADDKRQITACIASSLSGDLLPPQLIFQGKTSRSLPPHTVTSKASQAHLTFSDNHWSNQNTMQQYIEEIIMPYADRCINQHRLPADASIILVLDVWAVHKSEEFRRFLRTKHPRIQLIFIPANCTSKLQVADVMLQRPFKHGITKRFNEWAGQLIIEQIADGKIVGLSESLKMSTIKPLALQWCIESWTDLKEQPALIIAGWHQCCLSMYDVNDPQKRTDALTAVIDRKLEMTYLPDENEQDAEPESDHEEDSEDDELDLTKQRAFGTRGTRERMQTTQFGYQIPTSQIAMTEDSE
jgi:DDE superfamily endonuclease